MRISTILLVACGLIWSCSELTGAAESVAPKWNLVLILADDLGWSDLGCYGSDFHETPHLDRLAEQNVRFTNAYAASPVCTPTRASILTGKHPARLHMTIWRESAENRGRRELLEPVTLGDLPLEHDTLAELLRQAGYFCAHVGKWHLGTAGYYPQPHGFHMNVGGTMWGAPQSFFYPFSGDQYFSDWRYVPDLEPGNKGDYLTDRLTDRALQIIDQVGDKPFFLNLWYHSVHTPIEGKPEQVAHYQAKVADRPGKHTNPHYAAMVTSLDENVGRVLKKLRERHLDRKTIVVFLSDNGGFVNICRLQPGIPVTSNLPLRSGKGSLYEGGIRVPLIVSWPGVTEGRVCEQPVYSCDLMPTLLRMMELEASRPPDIDGVDISGLLRNPTAELSRDELYFHYPHYYPTTTPVSAVRVGAWKLMQYYEEERLELYDLTEDPGELRNLASSRPEIAKRLQEKLRDWLAETDAQFPTKNPDWKTRKKKR
jgi:arylsulfatase A-like enzyme